MGYWYHFCIMFEALFIMTLIDAGTRVGRYLLQELLGMVYKPLLDPNWKVGVYGCSALICLSWAFLVLGGDISAIWPLFGVSNQLLATMTLAIGTTVIMRLGRRRYAWVTGIPAIFMTIIALDSDYENVFHSYLPAGNWTLVVVSFIMFGFILLVLTEAIRSWMKVWNLPQDYRAQEEVEADTLKALKADKA